MIGRIDEKHWSAIITRRGEKIVNQLDLKKARRIGTDAKRVNVGFPAWMVDSLDREARRLGVTRQSLIKLRLADKLGQPTAASKR